MKPTAREARLDFDGAELLEGLPPNQIDGRIERMARHLKKSMVSSSLADSEILRRTAVVYLETWCDSGHIWPLVARHVCAKMIALGLIEDDVNLRLEAGQHLDAAERLARTTNR